MQVIEGTIMKGACIVINTAGIEGSKRKDGITYFGQITDPNGGMNDYNFPIEEKGIGKRHFMIKYHDGTRKYYIKDLADGTGTFIKISKTTKLESGYILSYGDTHMTINIDPDSRTIILKFLEGIRANEKIQFEYHMLPITIGRDELNTIVMNSINMSKKHCKISLINNEIFVIDGDGVNRSTNGTWLFAEKDFILENGTIFKAGQSLFRVEIIGS